MECRYYVGKEGAQQYLRESFEPAVIIDVFRCTSTIVAALASGARSVVPVEDVGDARRIAQELGAVLAGERNAVKIEGFDYGNSPSEMLKADIRGRDIVLSTTNGSKLMVERGIIASTLNVSAVAQMICGRDVSFILGGIGGYYVCGDDLALAKIIEKRVAGDDVGEWREMLRKLSRAEYLRSIGYSNDVDLILNGFDMFDIVPAFESGRVALKTLIV